LAFVVPVQTAPDTVIPMPMLVLVPMLVRGPVLT
jgi:hypothetical protein